MSAEEEKYEVASEGSSSNATEFVAPDTSAASLTGDKVHPLLWTCSLPSLLCNLFAAVVGVIEYNLVFYYSGLDAVALLSVYSPLQLLVGTYPLTAFSTATSAFIARALSQSHANVANIYLSHFFFVGLVWCILVAVCFGAPYAQLSRFLSVASDGGDALGRIYFLLMMVLGPILQLFSTAVSPFFRVENRMFVETFRQVILSLFILLFDLMLYFVAGQTITPGSGEAMVFLAASYIVTHAVVAVWMILVFLRKSILSVPLKGCLRFSLKRLFPINIKIVGRILLFAIPQYFNLAQTQLMVFVANLLYGYFYTDSEIIAYKRASYLLYSRYYALASFIPLALNQGFSILFSANLAAKRYRRIRTCLILAIIYILCLPVVVDMILFAVSTPLTVALQPSFAEEPEWEDAYLESAQPLVRWAFITPALMGPFYLSSSIAQVEGRMTLPFVLQLSRSVPTFICLLVMAFTIGDQADFTLAFPIGDACGIVLGVIAFAQYAVKYFILAKMDSSHDDNEPTAGEEDLANTDSHADAGDPQARGPGYDEEYNRDYSREPGQGYGRGYGQDSNDFGAAEAGGHDGYESRESQGESAYGHMMDESLMDSAMDPGYDISGQPTGKDGESVEQIAGDMGRLEVGEPVDQSMRAEPSRTESRSDMPYMTGSRD